MHSPFPGLAITRTPDGQPLECRNRAAFALKKNPKSLAYSQNETPMGAFISILELNLIGNRVSVPS